MFCNQCALHSIVCKPTLLRIGLSVFAILPKWGVPEKKRCYVHTSILPRTFCFFSLGIWDFLGPKYHSPPPKKTIEYLPKKKQQKRKCRSASGWQGLRYRIRVQKFRIFLPQNGVNFRFLINLGRPPHSKRAAFGKKMNTSPDQRPHGLRMVAKCSIVAAKNWD